MIKRYHQLYRYLKYSEISLLIFTLLYRNSLSLSDHVTRTTKELAKQTKECGALERKVQSPTPKTIQQRL